MDNQNFKKLPKHFLTFSKSIKKLTNPRMFLLMLLLDILRRALEAN